ncbi:MAG TPA: hypothetical protein VJ739_16945, partial [Gemmataceae bacterium]|nr:hypothetical protein [Gemmataceae bacterium]
YRNRLPVGAALRLPQPPPPPLSPHGFVLCPAFWAQGMTPEQCQQQQWLYHWALEQARAVVRPSILKRDLLAAWN